MPTHSTPWPSIWPFFIILILIISEFVIILFNNNGLLIFTLDDPYIHFALAENITRGHYGVNLSEYSAPASSIIWPFLLAPLSLLPHLSYSVLLINSIFSLATFAIIYSIICQSFDLKNGNLQQKIAAYLLLFSSIFIANLVGLIFTGMEHSLQVLLACIVVYGLMQEHSSQKISRGLIFALIAGPLVRYEFCALSAPVLIYLFFRGHKKESLAAGTLIGVLLSSFSLFLLNIGLDILPTSIIAKATNSASQVAPHVQIFNKLMRNIQNPIGKIVLIPITILIIPSIFRPKWAYRSLAFTVGISGLLHLTFGSLWWYGRYETYILAAMFISCCFIYKDLLKTFVQKISPLITIPLLTLPLLGMSLPSLFILATTPFGSHAIYNQPYQFHRFVKDYYKKPVGLNDLGWVSYKNDYYILDLWGLASKQALKHRVHRHDIQWMDDMAKKYNVGVIFITDSWFKSLPQHWIKLGTFNRGDILVTAFNGRLGEVSFYATSDEYVADAIKALHPFSASLPSQPTFTFAAPFNNNEDPSIQQ